MFHFLLNVSSFFFIFDFFFLLKKILKKTKKQKKMSEEKKATSIVSTTWPLDNFTKGLNVLLDGPNNKQYALFYVPTNSKRMQTLFNLYAVDSSMNGFGNGTVFVSKHLQEITDFPVLLPQQVRLSNVQQVTEGLTSVVTNYSSYVFASSGNSSAFVTFLLDPSNKFVLDPGSTAAGYKLQYISHPNISAIYAIELPPVKKVTIQTQADLTQYVNQFTCKCRVSQLQVFLARTMMSKIKGKKVKINSNLFDENTLASLGAPSGTTHMTLLYNSP
jgi:hypothetical protein